MLTHYFQKHGWLELGNNEMDCRLVILLLKPFSLKTNSYCCVCLLLLLLFFFTGMDLYHSSLILAAVDFVSNVDTVIIAFTNIS